MSRTAENSELVDSRAGRTDSEQTIASINNFTLASLEAKKLKVEVNPDKCLESTKKSHPDFEKETHLEPLLPSNSPINDEKVSLAVGSGPVPMNRPFRYSLQSITSQTSSEFYFEEDPDIIQPQYLNFKGDERKVESSSEMNRVKVMSEIVETERRYCADLAFIKKYRDPLLALAGTPQEIISKRSIQDIFSHYESILAVNLELKTQLENRLSEWSASNVDNQVGDIFLSISPFLRVYSLFLSNFNTSTSIVKDLLKTNQRFAAFIKQVDGLPESRNLTLNAFLMTPVQRIPRYKMLLEDLHKKTPENHADYLNLGTSIKLISEIASFVNEHIRDHEMAKEMLDLQKSIVGLKESLLVPGRRFLKRGSVLKISRRSHQQRQLLLFTDILIYASQGRLEEGSLQCHRSIPLSTLKINDIPDSDQVKNIFQLVNREKSFAVYTESLKEKEEWISAISDAIAVSLDKGTIRKEKNPSCAPVPDYTAPVWVPDDQASQCLVCRKDFSFLLRRHHCRFCGIVVCHPCSRNSFFAPSLDGERKSRICDKCFPTIVEKNTFKIEVAPISDYYEDRSSIDSSRTSWDLQQRISLDTIRQSRDSFRVNSHSLDIRRSSIDFRQSLDIQRNSFDINRIFSRRKSGSSSSSRFDVSTIYRRLTGRPLSHVNNGATPSTCTLCLNNFSLYLWKHQCEQCNRVICSSCSAKSSQMTLCDPCYKGIDPRDVIVNPQGMEWGARFPEEYN